MSALARQGKNAHEQNLLKQHREVWNKEHKKLSDHMKQVQHDLNEWQTNITLDPSLGLAGYLDDVFQYQLSLSYERKQLEDSTVHCIHKLKAGICGHMESENILKEIEKLKQNLLCMQHQLKEEFDSLSKDLTKDWEEEEKEREKGIPNKLLVLHYPSEKVRQYVLDELVQLDKKYQMQMIHLIEEKHVIE